MKAKLFHLILAILICYPIYAQESRTIEADYSKVKGPKSETYFKSISAGRAAEGLRADWRSHLEDVQSNFPFDYIRFHGLLHDDMGVCTRPESANGELKYNFQYIDELFDYLLSVNIKPFIELSFMPSVLSSEDKTVFWWKGNITPPKDYEQWRELITRLTKHLTKRYGEEEVKQWYFEVWNEPNHPSFFSSNMEEYFKLYTVSAEAVKSVNPTYRVGGPATAGNGWVSEIINYCDKNNVPLDFITTHAYGVFGAFDEYGVMQLKLVNEALCVAGGVNASRKRMNDLGRNETELHYTEWSSSYSPRDLTHDTYFNAAYILNTLRNSDEAAQSMSYWTFTDIFEESGIPTEPFHGGFGFINTQGFRKPTYFAYKYLYQLGEQELVNNDANSWVCRDSKGGIQVLAYNLTMPEYKEFEYNNLIFSKLRPAKDIEPLEIKISNLPNGKYRLEVYYTGFEKNDIQTAYIKLGSPSTLYPEQEELLRLASQDKVETLDVIEIKDGTFSNNFKFRENDICLIKLTPIN